jgi:cyclase
VLQHIEEALLMDYRRIIPCLDMKDGRVVKGVHFVDLRDAGDPVENAAAYSRAGADEIALLDIAASVEGRKTFLEIVRRVAEVVDVPFTVGGGIGSVEDMEAVLEAGATNVSINTAAANRPELVKEAAEKFGSERVIVAVDGRKNAEMPSGYELVTHGGTRPVGTDAAEWARQVADLGAGQILPTSMETDGVKTGYDIPFTRSVAEASGLPVIASGGAGKLEHLYEAIVDGKADAVLAASIFHFGEIGIREAKEYLRDKGIPVSLSAGS